MENLRGKEIALLAAGGHHSLVVANEELYSFGNGEYGQLGHDASAENENLPRKVEIFQKKRIELLAAGGAHSLVLADGELWSFGFGEAGQLGHGDCEDQRLPKKVEVMRGKRIKMIAAGDFLSLVVTEEGELWSFGDGSCGQLGHSDYDDQLLPKKVESLAGKYVEGITAGSDHCFALVDGELSSFGLWKAWTRRRNQPINSKENCSF